MSDPISNLRILYVNHEKWAGGATVHRDEFVAAAQALGVNLVQFPEPRTVVEEGREGGLRQRFKRWLFRRWTELAILLMTMKQGPGEIRALARAKPDVLLVNHTFRLSAILLGRVFGVPVVLQIHSPWYLDVQNANLHLRLLRFWKWLESRAVGLASAVVVVSNALRDYYVALGFPKEQFTVVPNGVDRSRFKVTLAGDAIRNRLGLTGSLVVGFVGILEPWTGVDWFLEALPGLGAALDNLAVLIVGTGGLESRLRQIVARSGLEDRVRFAGFVPHAEVPEYMASFDIAVAPYRKVEPFCNSPMKLHEYMAMGKPILTPRMGQSAELIQHGENGLLYEPDDANEMLERLGHLMHDADLRARLGRTALARCHEMNWTWECNAAAILKVCRAVTGTRADGTISSLRPS